MRFPFGIKLTLTMVVFAVAITSTIAVTDYLRLRDQVLKNKWEQVKQNEMIARQALETIEKAYALFGDDIAGEMKANSDALLDLYGKNPSFAEWDFAALKQSLGSDIYIIDSRNVIVYSSFEADIGLDFSACCKKLAKLLDERRKAGTFFHDGIDIEQRTGMLKKYSYIATPDKRYLIQLGYSLQDREFFKQFNFRKAIDEIVRFSSSINQINILNWGGFVLGDPSAEDPKLPEERRSAFEQALLTGQPTEFRGKWNGEPAIYRYVRYQSNYDTGSTGTKVMELVYNEKEVQTVLDQNKNIFLIQLAGILLIAVALSFIITRWVARPMYLAFHDSLTGLKNRAAFDDLLETAISETGKTAAVLMIDLDNFKWVNDNLGHDTGDRLLKSVAQSIRRTARKTDMTVRLGGDEFVLIMPSASRQAAEETAQRVIDAIVASTSQAPELEGVAVTVSIGIALSPEHGEDPETLCKNADLALYAAKESGKNRYWMYGIVEE